ncbi:hypothetical protein [Streptomyces sp. SID11385]|uniref:hypothetical protein n=1 Tax=Streptomyces sp. SID11385 TaxID=2706031 RepID=UPI0013CD2455|nr:hypothetical protein [Streptomyces sp. SID11385]NEA43824.1 hypothetical protein [Streptomyces sp. SID11385]
MSGQIIEGPVEVAKLLVVHWWNTQTVPFLVARREALVLKQQARRAKKKVLRIGITTATPAAVRESRLTRLAKCGRRAQRIKGHCDEQAAPADVQDVARS